MTEPVPADGNPSSMVIVRAADTVIREVAGGNHVTNLLSSVDTGHLLDAIDVYARPGGGPPPHRHGFGEWFFVRSGRLTITGVQDDELQVITEAQAGDSVWIPPWTWHGTVNASDQDTQFLVIGVPGIMTGYFERAGVVVPDATTPADPHPPGPGQLSELAAQFQIEFFTGGHSHTSPTPQ